MKVFIFHANNKTFLMKFDQCSACFNSDNCSHKNMELCELPNFEDLEIDKTNNVIRFKQEEIK